jgi:hypothetical protein
MLRSTSHVKIKTHHPGPLVVGVRSLTIVLLLAHRPHSTKAVDSFGMEMLIRRVCGLMNIGDTSEIKALILAHALGNRCAWGTRFENLDYSHRVEAKPAAQAGCQFLAFEGLGLPSGWTTAGKANLPDSPGDPICPVVLM